MFTTFAHAGYGTEIDGAATIDHCMPIIIGAGVAIAILVGIVVYMLIAWEPKKAVKANKKKTTKN
jgi:hypothetical protein